MRGSVFCRSRTHVGVPSAMKKLPREGNVSVAKRPQRSGPPAGEVAQPGAGPVTAELATLYAALDNIENGVILLDKDLRAQYANAAAHTMFESRSEFIRGKPLYAEMLQHARRSSAYAVSPEEL